MKLHGKYLKYYFVLLAILIIVAMLNLRLGSVWISWDDFRMILSGREANTSLYTIVWEYRFPKLLVAAAAGSGLGLAGLLMQTMFRNPIVGPYVLGLSSGSGLAVALLIMTGIAVFPKLNSAYAISAAAIGGSSAVLLLNLALYKKVKRTEVLLIAGLMIGAFSGAVLSILSVFAPAEKLQRYFFWTMGNLTVTQPLYLWMIGIGVGTIYFLAFTKVKYLNLLLLGDDYVVSSGVNLKRLHLFVIILTGILTGLITAVTGPLAFTGLIIPHITRMIFRTEMLQYLIPGVFLTGSGFMILTDIVAQLPGSTMVLPVNSITALLGAPLVVHLLLRNLR
jgi:iron complex transport system permease protein